MGKVLLDLAVSLDGYIDGPDGSDVGLYDWYAATSGPNADIAAETVATTGAIVVGRGVFGRGDDATGWDETPYEVPHFVVTHRPPRTAGGPVDFRFVEGVREAVAAAQETNVREGRLDEALCVFPASSRSTLSRCTRGGAAPRVRTLDGCCTSG